MRSCAGAQRRERCERQPVSRTGRHRSGKAVTIRTRPCSNICRLTPEVPSIRRVIELRAASAHSDWRPFINSSSCQHGCIENPSRIPYPILPYTWSRRLCHANDSQGHTLTSASTLDPEMKDEVVGKVRSAKAGLVGSLVAKRALSKGINQVVFDRGGYKYHGRVKALAEAARREGLKF